MTSDLVLIDRARAALAEARSIPDVLDVRDKAASIENYLRRRSGAEEAARHALEIRLRAERKVGALLIEAGVGSGRKDATLSSFGVQPQQSSRWQRIAALPEPDFEDELAKPEPATAAMLKRWRVWSTKQQNEQHPASAPRTCTVEDLEALAASGRKFGTVYADPPWQYGNQSTRAATDNHYVTMPFDEIAALPISDLADEKAHLHLWTTNGFIQEAFRLIEAWGFEYKSMFVWVKPSMGIGNYWRVSHEIMLLGVRGSLTFLDHSQKSWLEAPKSRHSAKPYCVRNIIEKTSPPDYLELFGREACEGWTVWGNEVAATLFARTGGLDES